MPFFKFSFLCVLSLLVVACTDRPNQTDIDEQLQITGQFSYRERIALPPGSTAKITLEDVSIADKAAEIIHIKSMPLEQQVPISFSLTVAKQNLHQRHRYTLRVSIYDPDGQLMWTSDSAHTVDISQNKQNIGHILLVRTQSASPASREKISRYQCGRKTVTLTYQDDIAVVKLDQESTSLIRVKTASGAKYASADGQLIFWNKADKATITLADKTLPECQQIKARDLLPLKAQGNEPGWSISAKDMQLHLNWDYGQQQADLDIRQLGTTSTGYQLDAESVDIKATVIVTQQLCRDVMTGQPFPLSVQVKLNDQTLNGCGGDSNALLTGTEWTVEDIDQRGMIDYSRVTLNFNDKGQLSGLASCNHYSATYQWRETLQISQAISTQKACPPALMNQENRFLKLLTQVRQLEFDSMGALLLSTADGRTITARR